MAFDRAKSGVGASLGFGTTTGLNAIEVTSISVDGVSVPDLNLTHLSSVDFFEYAPGELREGGTLTVGFLVDNDNIPLPGQTASTADPVRETITLTQVINDGSNTTAGTCAMVNSYINNTSWSYVTDDVSAGEYTIKVGGIMTFTASSA